MVATLLSSYPFTTDFSAVSSLQSQGTIVDGSASPAGISNGISIVNGVYRSYISQSDTVTATGIRSECVFTAAALGDENWFTWQSMLPSADWTDTTGDLIWGQMHCLDSISGAVNFALRTKSGQLHMDVPLSDPPTVSTNSLQIPIAPLRFDYWYSFCLHAKWLNTDFGFLEFFVDGVAVTAGRRFNRGTAYNADAPYFKLGLYDAPHLANFGTKAALFKNLEIYSGVDSYSNILGAEPRSPASLITI